MDFARGSWERNALQVKRTPSRRERDRRRREQRQICPFCDPGSFPPLLAIFPRLRGVTVDAGASWESGVVWKGFCKGVVQGRGRGWVTCTDVGEGVLQGGERRLGMKVTVVDGKLRRVWEVVRRLRREEVRRFVETGLQSEGVRDATRVSERLADGLLRLFWFYDAYGRAPYDEGERRASVDAEAGSQAVDDNDELEVLTRTAIRSQTAHLYRWLNAYPSTETGSNADDEEVEGRTSEHRASDLTEVTLTASTLAESFLTESTLTGATLTEATHIATLTEAILTGATRIEAIHTEATHTEVRIKPKRPLDFRWDTCHWPRDFLTPLNWALRVWLKRDNGD